MHTTWGFAATSSWSKRKHCQELDRRNSIRSCVRSGELLNFALDILGTGIFCVSLARRSLQIYNIICIVLKGVRSKDEALQMKLAGADAVYVGVEHVQGIRRSSYDESKTQEFLGDLKDALTGDD